MVQETLVASSVKEVAASEATEAETAAAVDVAVAWAEVTVRVVVVMA